MAGLPRWFWILLAALAVAGALGTLAIDRSRERRLQSFASRVASSARDAAGDGLRARLEVLSGQTASAAQLPQLRANLGPGFDTNTLRDGFQNEPWWAPVRNEFRVYGIALQGDKLDVIEGDGMAAGDLDVQQLVRAARAQRQSSAVLAARSKNGWPYLAAAAVLDVPGREVAPVVVLARPLDEAIAKELANRAGGAVVIAAGKAVLLAVGEGKDALKALAERGESAPLSGDDGSWAAARQELAPGLAMWTYVANAHAAEEGGAALLAKLVLWGLIAAAVAAAGAIATRARVPEPAPVRPGTDPALRTPILSPSGTSSQLVTPGPDTMEAEGVTAVRAAPTPRTNVFGRYVLLDRLGEGGMAEVYTAVAFGAENFRRTFVVKRLRPEMAREHSVVSAFIDEANLASSLVHSNIVPVFDFGKVGDEYFLAQEYIVGRDLGRITRRSLESECKPIPAAQVFFIASEVLKALDYAHGRIGEGGKPMQIVHRDVSPNNILVSARGEVKLFDFGIAKAEGRLTQTQAGVVKGNVRFMSPEQARGLAVDSRSDLFSLGLVVYYALAGDSLYEGSNGYELLMRAAQGPGPAEMAKVAALGEPASHVLMRALQPDVNARHQSAAEFATALHPYLAGAPAALVRTMEHLFAADIRDEEARFASAMGRTGTTGERAAIK